MLFPGCAFKIRGFGYWQDAYLWRLRSDPLITSRPPARQLPSGTFLGENQDNSDRTETSENLGGLKTPVGHGPLITFQVLKSEV